MSNKVVVKIVKVTNDIVLTKFEIKSSCISVLNILAQQ
jgi:hypothetical protein